MPFEKKKSEADVDAQTSTLLQAAAMASSGSDMNKELANELLELVRMDMADRRKKKDEEEANMRRFIAARHEAFKEEIQRRELGQQLCNHRKEDQRSRIGGQRLSNGHIAYICQFCQKTWDERSLPASLQIQGEFIGG